ncbi:T9SS type A sorting domain-containing protein [bacterium SCSIO 12643]|nr:T9SS type A sorting domain-containing protein [bacterium SCSIO 12643]
MKKTLLFAGALALASNLSAQIFSEDFEGGSMPAGWGVTTNATDGGWNVGTANTLGSQYFPLTGNNTQFAATNDDDCNCDKSDDFLYTAAIDLTNQSGAVFMKYSQYYFAAAYQGAQEVATVEVSTNGGSSYSVLGTLSGAGAWTDVIVDLSSYAGQNIMVGFRYNDDGGWVYGMGIDDISVYVPADEDVTLSSLDIPNYSKLSNGAVDIKGSIRNNGGAAITSMDVEYTVNGGSPVAATLTGLNVAPLTDYDFTHTTPWTPSAEGDYTIEVKVTAVNGVADADISDNVQTHDINVYTNAYPRVVLYETFTSSTCPPCVPGNANFEGIIATLPDSQFASIKYQMSWPGNGDPYNAADGNTRRGYYNISSVPGMEIDGGWDGNSNSFTAALHDAALEVPAFVNIDAEYNVTVDDQTVRTCATITALKDLGNASLQIAIKEHKTVQNVGTNGETEFFDVVKKMVPDADGETVNITAGMNQKICKDYTFQGNFRLPNSAQDLINDATEHSVEEFTDLGVVVWLQASDKTVFNAANATSGITSVNNVDAANNNINIYPNPAVSNTTLAISSADAANASIKVLDLVGKTVIYMNNVKVNGGQNNIELNTASLNAGVYMVEVTIDGQVSTSQLVIQK